MSLQTVDIPVAPLRQAARRDDVLAAMRAFYDETDRLIAARNPLCRNRGLCCRFVPFGHRLFVTALEAAYWLAGNPAPARASADACPYARNAVCHTRDRRPLGCRLFFCDPASRSWQAALSEERLARLRRLHEELRVPYFYADWMAVLAALAGDAEGSSRPG